MVGWWLWCFVYFPTNVCCLGLKSASNDTRDWGLFAVRRNASRRAPQLGLRQFWKATVLVVVPPSYGVSSHANATTETRLWSARITRAFHDWGHCAFRGSNTWDALVADRRSAPPPWCHCYGGWHKDMLRQSSCLQLTVTMNCCGCAFQGETAPEYKSHWQIDPYAALYQV